MGDSPIFSMFNSAVDIWLYNWRTALHYLACVYTALAGICGAPVYPRTSDNWEKSQMRGQKQKLTQNLASS
jgi:hypothetical protein